MSTNGPTHAPPWVPVGGGETGDLIRSIDWSQTPVGPIDSWPRSLLSLVQTLLHSRHPMFLFWGPELIQFYNDAYLPSFGAGKHPRAMGQRGRECWDEIWSIIGPQIDGVMLSGTPTWHENALVPIHRNGRLEDVFWTYGYSPAFDDAGRIGGTLVVCTETTSGVLANRRLAFMAKLTERVGLAVNAREVLENAFSCFSEMATDVPFAAAYAAKDQLTASTGLEADGVASLNALALRFSATREASHHVLEEPIVAGPWPEPVTEAVVVPLSERRCIVFGLSPRLPFDSAYRDFLHQIVELLQASKARVRALANRIAIEAERRDLLMQAPIAAAITRGPSHRFELANPRYVEMVGREVLGLTYVEAFPEIAGTPVLDVVDRVYRDGVPHAEEEMLVQLDRNRTGVVEDRYFKFNLQPIRNTQNEVSGMMVIAMDITDIVRAREAEAQAHAELQGSHDERTGLIEQLEGANRAKDEFLAMLGHELRNPLAPIVMALELIQMRDDGQLSREHQIISRQVQHLVRLVDDLLDVARITQGKVELKKESAEIGDIVSKAIEMADSALEKRQHELTVQIDEELRWWGDPTRLAQVVANLLTNAARYTDPGGRIYVSATREGEDEFHITVADNGRGIAADRLDTIFDMFVQGPQRTDRAEGGLGLGLTLVKNLVALHGGSVTAKSDGPGCGSTFIVRLPATHSRQPPPVRPSLPTTASKRILVVDDNRDAAEVIGALLRSQGHVVEIAHDGLAAMRRFEAVKPQVAVLDIGLPVIDGYELATRISRAPGGEACRLIAITGYGQRRDRERAAAAGFQAHLIKPVNFEELIEAINADHPADQP